ncbi:uncharacterized protein J8A68_004269 [[Candida] subhashii]|uniref:MRH domain-containing protein n=1 Tax=[Candida] subhashii TaxID=561895 RepID=A0A8J5QHR5_9ASCO|nr:uncharacterized protein J8A68_004269 [[Candida] subhashii]KAG7662259.1 hypothetical protein J8A68_004269 [[Candida] subhashii]
MLNKQLILLASLIVSACNTQIQGVSPDKQHLYQPIEINGKQYWQCLNDSSIKLTYDQINDDYCDCPDGSDEPGTNACPYSSESPKLFYCENKGHIPGYIENYKLNDGVCDYDICCDGSDEYKSGNCENKCVQIHEQYVKHKERIEDFIGKALKKKETSIKLAKHRRDSLVNEKERYEPELAIKKAQLEQLKLQLEEKELDEEFGRQDTESAYELLSEHFAELNEKLESHKKYLNIQESNIEKLEKILAQLASLYNPNFNDPAVKDTIRHYQEYVSNKETEVKRDLKETDQILEKLKEKAKSLTNTGIGNIVPTIGNVFHYYFQLFANKYLEKQITSKVQKSNLSVNELGSKIEALEKDIIATEKKLNEINKDLNLELGPNDILRAYSQATVSKKLGGYHYNINLMKSIYQDDVLIGKFKEYKDNKVHFQGGSKCWNGPYRSADIEFVCGTGPEILSVSEPEKCHYHFIIQGESWCEPITEDQILSDFTIDFDKL